MVKVYFISTADALLAKDLPLSDSSRGVQKLWTCMCCSG